MHNFKVALVCIAKNEENYIEEWIDYHLGIGFDHIFVYQNDWNYDINKKNVTTIKYDGINKQHSAYGDFIKKYCGVYKWAAFFDVDEFLLLKKHNSIKDFIIEYGTQNCIAINWVIFGDNNNEKVINNNYSLLYRFTMREYKINPHIKSVCKIHPKMFFICAHSTNDFWADTNGNIGIGPLNFKGDDKVAQINHYFCKTKQEFLDKMKRGRADNDPNVSPQFEIKIKDFHKYNKNEIEEKLIIEKYKKIKYGE